MALWETYFDYQSVNIGHWWWSLAAAYNFVTTKPAHWCNVPSLATNFSFDQQKYIAIPTDENGDYKQCERFDMDFDSFSKEDFYNWTRNNGSLSTIRCDQGWIYDKSEYSSSIITQFDLVCGRNSLIALPPSMSILGQLLAGPSAGFISDTFGRKTAILYFTVWSWISFLLMTFGNQYWMYVLAWPLSSYGSHGGYMVQYVLGTELVGKKYRSTVNNITQINFTVFSLVTTMWAYFFKDAFILHIVTTIPNVIGLFILWWIPESPRWLIVSGKYEKASNTIKHIADVNKRPMPENFVEKLQKLKVRTKNSEITEDPTQRTCSTRVLQTALVKVAALLKTKQMRRRTIILTIHWMADVMMYYALSYNYRFVPGNIIVVSVIINLLELPSLFLSIFFLNWRYTGRRITCAMTMLLAGIFAFVTFPFQYFGIEAGETTFIMLGRLCILMAFACIYVYTPELHPTKARSTGMGFSSMLSRITGMAAPFIGGPLKEIQPYLPNIFFGTIGVISGGLTFLLPETLGQSMPDTVNDVVKTDKNEHQHGDSTRECDVESSYM